MASSETMEVQAGKRCMTILPHEMIELILMMVPVSTLLRCHRVCRQWRLILRDPRFITAQKELDRAAPRCPLLFSHRESASKKLYPSEAILFDEAWSPSRWDVPVIEPDDFLVACCNGLACLYSERSTLKIANLATGECLHLRKPDNRMTVDHYSFYSFGFHPVTKQYKVIRFLGERELFSVDTFIVIQIYTLGDDRWRDVRAPRAQRFDCVDYFGVVNVDGAMYWLTEDKGKSWKRSVASFDLGEERVEWIQLPVADLSTRHSRMYWITEVDGKVCVATAQDSYYSDTGFVGELQIWTLENKAEQRWKHKCTIQSSMADICIPRPYFISGDKIILYGHDRNIYYQKLTGQNIKIERRKMLRLLNYSPRWYSNMRSFMYVKSLERLDVYRRGAVFHRPKQQKGWKLKKWENWMLELCLLEKLWRRIYELEHSISVWWLDFHYPNIFHYS
jgi:F-box interacting protein